MDPRSKVAVLGHSFIRRMDRDIRNVQLAELQRNFGLAQCRVQFRWSGGWEVFDAGRFNSVFRPFLQVFHPAVVVLQVGGNDIDCSGDLQTLFLASEIEDLAQRLINVFGVTQVFIGEIFKRERPRNITFDQYEGRRISTMDFLTTLLEHEPNIRIWRHRRIFGSQQDMFAGDGIHLNDLGQRRFYRSLRLAIKTAVDQL